MAPSRTSTVKSKHASNKSGIRNSKTSSKAPQSDGVVKQKSEKSKRTQSTGVSFKQQRKVRTGNGDLQGKGADGKGSLASRLKKKGRRVYTEKELGIPTLNMITPVGVEKPKGGKKGKVFVDDRESMLTILAMVNADKEGQIESKMMKSRQMEQIREARKVEAEKKYEERKQKLDETKEGLRKKRKRSTGAGGSADREESSRDKASKPLKKKKSVSFA